jgi:serine/threonine protein kinase
MLYKRSTTSCVCITIKEDNSFVSRFNHNRPANVLTAVATMGNKSSVKPRTGAKHSHPVDHGNLITNMVRFRDDDILSKYIIVRKIGEGSIGSIAQAKVRPDKIGGSALKSHNSGMRGCFGFLCNSRKATLLDSEPTEKRNSEVFFAVKTIMVNRIKPEYIEELRNEIDILRTLDHPNIVKVSST